MSLIISSQCIGCHACKLVCPQKAITKADAIFTIGHRCDECASQSFSYQCAAICPVENAILTHDGQSLNPSNSLRPSVETLQTIKQLQEGLV